MPMLFVMTQWKVHMTANVLKVMAVMVSNAMILMNVLKIVTVAVKIPIVSTFREVILVGALKVLSKGTLAPLLLLIKPSTGRVSTLTNANSEAIIAKEIKSVKI